MAKPKKKQKRQHPKIHLKVLSTGMKGKKRPVPVRRMYKISRKRGTWGDTFVWNIPSGTKVTFFFPGGRDPFGLHGSTAGPGSRVAKKALYRPSFGSLRATHRFQYAVYCHSRKTFAQMNSEPEVIIDGP